MEYPPPPHPIPILCTRVFVQAEFLTSAMTKDGRRQDRQDLPDVHRGHQDRRDRRDGHQDLLGDLRNPQGHPEGLQIQGHQGRREDRRDGHRGRLGDFQFLGHQGRRGDHPNPPGPP
ncbi:hypothetical protein N7481_000902 [Penicillium waksmanii]|uniref:uncharacterized protein n=1 Tax=Penicillium waksmanii TaxID=69791 RepID=UPI0025480F6F|nr:uncharacterized protein N7481_000902 [Penicillium waksmanii]KAJ6000493.1 hypothetical protein N7481_000902 [Penicillium waksmanii]